jgi:molecular chaperone Hsp33
MSEAASEDPDIEVRTYFARGRNALIARADFSELYASLYLHQMDIGQKAEGQLDQLLRDTLAALTLHCASRPWKESVAWTINFQDPLANVFVSGDNQRGTVIGNIFTENVKETNQNLFYSDVVADGQPSRRSVIEFTGNNFFEVLTKFYQESEQRPARIFRHSEEDLVLVAAQPDCDLEWLEKLDEQSIQRLDQEVELSLLETRRYRFECGCNQDRMLTILAPLMRRQPEELFGGEETIRVRCPRCGAKYTITREALEARVAADETKSEAP